MVVVEWGHEERREVASASELDELLNAIAAEARAKDMPQDVQVMVPEAGTLGIVVGAERSVLNHVPADNDPPYSMSVGDQDGEEPWVFYVAGDRHSETLRRNTISSDAARRALHHFVRTGALSSAVQWEEV